MGKVGNDKSLAVKTILLLIVIIAIPVILGVYYENSKCMDIKSGAQYEFVDENTILVFSGGKEAFVTLDCEYIGKDGKRAIWRLAEKSQISMARKTGKLCTDDEIIVDGISCLVQVGKIGNEQRLK